MVSYMMLTKYVTHATARSHLVILQESSSISKDSDLQLVITNISDYMSNTQPKSVEEVIDRAMIRVTIAVGKELLDGNVLLLPDVHDNFAHMQLTANGISDTVNMSAVRERVHSLLRGCKCSEGCVNKRCGCRSKGKLCSIGCQCLNCVNTDNAKHKQGFL